MLYKDQEKQQQQEKIKEKEKEILKIMNDTNQQTNQVMVKLDAQGNKINQIEDNFIENGNNLNKTQWMLRNIKSFGGQIKGLFTKPKIEEKQKKQEQIQIQNKTQIQNQNLQQNQKKDEFLDQLQNELNILQQNQKLIGQTIDQQNSQLNKINSKADKQTSQMNKQNNEIKKIIK